MAAPSSSSSSSSSKSRENFDVFLSFRGADVRNTFISRLYEKLRDRGVFPFKDSEKLELGDRRGELFEAIHGSRIAIVTFSENYARSKWCLNELMEIMEREKLEKIVVLPVFYKVTPREVRLHEKEDGEKGCYQVAMEEMEAKYGRDMADIWRKVLQEGGDLIGEHVKVGYDEGLVVRRVVDKVLKILNRVPMEVAKYPTGIESRLRVIKPLLHMSPHVDDVFMIGIHGIGGGGKTTLAKALCNDIADKFDDWCFLRDVRKTDIVVLQQNLLRQLLREPDLIVPSVDQGKHLIKDRLRHKRVLVILDDVDNLDQLDALAGDLDWFGKQSRVIITTRNGHVLASVPAHQVYSISLLDADEARSLFLRHAFPDGRKNKKIDDQLIESFLEYAAGLPLALAVLGAFLSGREEPEWISTLEKLDKYPEKNINSVLKISFDGLDNKQKEVFLDIACFFNGWKRNSVMKILDSCGFDMLIDTEVLAERCLVTVEEDDIRMHDLLEVMGKGIVRDEEATGIPSRIWTSNDFFRVLADGVVPENYVVKGIVVLDSGKKEKKLLKANTFKFSRRLRLLIVRNAFDPKEPLNFLQELRWLEWPGYSASTVRFDSCSQLVGLDMHRSNIKGINGKKKKKEEEEEEQEFEKLKYINLSSCKSLSTLPNLSRSSKLQELNLQGCKNLTRLDEAIGSLDELVHLNLKECYCLSTFPSSLTSKHFRTLNFSGCSKLTRFPDIEKALKFLELLFLDGTAVNELPDSIVNLVAVKILSMNSCRELYFIPASISKLENLEDLRLNCCGNLKEVQGLPPHLVRLYMVDCQRLRTFPRLHTFMGRSPRIHSTDLSGCWNLGSDYMNESLPYQEFRKFQEVAIVILPAEDIPHWMSFQTTECGSEYRVALPEGMLEDDILGLALSVNFEVDPRIYRFKRVDCVLNHKTIGVIHFKQRESANPWLTDFDLEEWDNNDLDLEESDKTDHNQWEFVNTLKPLDWSCHPNIVDSNPWKSAHTWFTYHPRQLNDDRDEEDYAGGMDWSNITFRFLGRGFRLKKCGAHVVCRQEQDDMKFVVHGNRRQSDSEFDF